MANSSTSSRIGLAVGASLMIIAAFLVSNAQSGLRMFGHGEHYSKVGQSFVDRARTFVRTRDGTQTRRAGGVGRVNAAVQSTGSQRSYARHSISSR